MPFLEKQSYMLKRFVLLLSGAVMALQASAQDSVKASASTRYEGASIFQRMFLGGNYRESWSVPVQTRVFHMNKEKGGFTIKELGGGMQTKSLQIKDRNGTEYVLRSLDKDVIKAMEAEGIKNKQVRQLSQNMISAAHPYGSLTLPPMAKAIGILSTDPELVYIQDDPAFGEHQKTFANMMAYLEVREPVFHKGDDVKGTDKLHKDLEKRKNYRVDQKMLLQARLLDMLVGDWDRHDDQWKWEYHKQGDGSTIIYPIPRDHDQAYFNSNGMLFFVMRTINAKRFVGFRKGLKLRSLNYKQWSFDKEMMKDLSEEDWRTGTLAFQKNLTDASIEEGVRRLPPEIYAIHGAELIETLKVRRDKMPRDVMRYYHFLKENPDKVKKQGDEQRAKMEKAENLKNPDKANSEDKER